ncbi:MAG TPA: DNA polymerase ligase N-terminal domain-containing protein [Pirellulales bacterium]
MDSARTPSIRFVVLRHAPGSRSSRALHWDFMVEVGDSLRTWALAEEPTAQRSIEAHALPPHRLAYLEYEGAISADRGMVAQWDHGTYSMLADSEDLLILDLAGGRLRGQVRLTRQKDSTGHWIFRFSSGLAATSD